MVEGDKPQGKASGGFCRLSPIVIKTLTSGDSLCLKLLFPGSPHHQRWRENENGIIKQEICCIHLRGVSGRIGTPNQPVHVLLTGKNHSPTKKENVSNIFKLQYFKRKKLFFVLCTALNLKKDSFINSLSYPKF